MRLGAPVAALALAVVGACGVAFADAPADRPGPQRAELRAALGRAKTTDRAADALALLRPALATARRLGDVEFQGLLELEIAKASLDVDDQKPEAVGEALKLGLDAWSHLTAAGDRRHVADTLGTIAEAYAAAGRLDLAREGFERTRATFGQLGDAFGEEWGTLRLAQTFASLGDPRAADEAFSDALRINDRTHDLGLRHDELMGLASVRTAAPVPPAEIASLYREAAALAHGLRRATTEAADLAQAAAFELAAGDESGASRDAALARDRAGASDGEPALAAAVRSYAELILAGIKAKSSDPRVLREQSAALLAAMQRLQSSGRAPAEMASSSAELERGLGRTDEALRDYEAALDQIDAARAKIGPGSLEQRRYVQARARTYDGYIALLYDLDRAHPGGDYATRALAIYERLQGRQFFEYEANRIADRALLSDAERQELSRLGAVAANRDGRLSPAQQAAAAAEVDAYRARLGKLHPRYGALIAGHPASPAAIRAALRSGEAMLLYHVGNDATYVWAVDPTPRHAVLFARLPVGGFGPLDQLVRAYQNGPERVAAAIRQHVDYRERARITERGFAETGWALYRALFPPAIAERIASAKTVYVVAGGPLANVPFEALVEADPAGGAPRYLVERHAFAYLSSGSLLAVLRDPAVRQRSHAASPLLGVAVQRFERSGCRLDPLPQTASQVAGIASILRAPAGATLLGDAATRAALLGRNENGGLSRYRYLVFATHALAQPCSPQAPDGPSLVLASAGGADAFASYLTMSDVYRLRLNADLVVLSACDTGNGVSEYGEGVVGLARAFMIAGTPAVSVTLWSVEANASGALTEEMFRHLARGETPAEALRAAKRTMIADPSSRNPFFWAPFVIFGDGA